MTNLRLSYASACDYDRTRALADSRISPVGIDLNFMVLSTVEELFWRTALYQDFDASEFSFGSYLVGKTSTQDHFLPLIAIPVFPSRAFRHSAIFVNAHAGIERPEDLKGKTLGVPEYQLTAITWARGILQHEYDVHPEDIRAWRTGGVEQAGRIEKLVLDLPPGVNIEPIPKERTLNEMLDAGEIDALISPRMPSCFINGSPNVHRLFENYPAVEREYYEKTGIFPIMHVVVLRQDVYEANRWIARNLYSAFEEAKDIALNQAYESVVLRYSMPWMLHAIEEQRSLFGADPWPYGLEPNVETIAAFIQYSYEQGLIKRKIDVEELFAPETIGTGSKI
jgi:4,5-dihydroxyphthalate decarboxylase